MAANNRLDLDSRSFFAQAAFVEPIRHTISTTIIVCDRIPRAAQISSRGHGASLVGETVDFGFSRYYKRGYCKRVVTR
jgi:hypothetical protein